MTILRSVFVTCFIKLVVLCSVFNAFKLNSMEESLSRKTKGSKKTDSRKEKSAGKKEEKAIEYKKVILSFMTPESYPAAQKPTEAMIFDMLFNKKAVTSNDFDSEESKKSYYEDKQENYPEILADLKESKNFQSAQFYRNHSNQLVYVLVDCLENGKKKTYVRCYNQKVITGLHAAVLDDQFEVLKQLLKHKHDPNTESDDQVLPIEHALWHNRNAMAELLIQYGAHCRFDEERPCIIAFYSSLAERLGAQQIQENLIEKLLQANKRYACESLNRLNTYLDKMIPRLNATQDPNKLYGMKRMQQKLHEILGASSSSRSCIEHKESRSSSLMRKLSPKERLEFLKLGGITAAGLTSSSNQL